MLESMIENPLPTRAEVSDVANAIHDGTSAIMLSAETSAGKHPIEAVRMMARIACETETSLKQQGFRSDWEDVAEQNIPEIIADAAYHCARTAGVVALAVGTSFGCVRRLLARYRPPVPIYAFTSSEERGTPAFHHLWSGCDRYAGNDIDGSHADTDGAFACLELDVRNRAITLCSLPASRLDCAARRIC